MPFAICCWQTKLHKPNHHHPDNFRNLAPKLNIMNDFAATGLNPDIVRAIAKLGFESPTPIQAKTIPHLLDSDKDLIALAQTGTGKTAAFGLPALHLTDIDNVRPQTLILCPTRELCIQISRDLASYATETKGLKVLSVYGGTSIEPQIKALKAGVHIVVGTPGRTKDLISRKKLKLNHIQRVILDEADEMLTMGFKDELDAILEQTPEEKQTLLFSATISSEIRRISKSYMNDPDEIAVARANAGATNVEHWFYLVMARDKYNVLKRIADINPTIYGIVFCRTRRETKEIAGRLMTDGYNADVLNGDLSQAQRDEVMDRFRKRQIQILVATDVAARGLDVNDLTHVINFTLPDDPEVYVHRSGRTGRAGKSGISIAIIHSREKRRILEAERKAGIRFERKAVPTGREICKVQLMNLVDKIMNVEVDEKEIAPFLPSVYEKLGDLSREDLIKHFVSAEFNRFLDYYKNVPDIDGASGSRRKDRGDKKRKDRDGRGDRGGDRFGNDSEKPFRPGRKERTNHKFAKVVISAGSAQKMHASKLIGLVNNTLDSSDAAIGRITIQNKVSYIEIDKNYADDLVQGLRKKKLDGKKLMADISDYQPAPKKSKSKKGGKAEGGKKKKDRHRNRKKK